MVVRIASDIRAGWTRGLSAVALLAALTSLASAVYVFQGGQQVESQTVPAESDEGAWPEVGAVVRSWAHRTGVYDAYLCAGVLVDNWHFVTAAHCVADYEAADILVAVTSSGNLCEDVDLYPVADVEIAQDYRSGDESTPDIARIEMSVSSLLVSRLNVSSVGDRATSHEAMVVGWLARSPADRRPCELQELSVPLHSDRRCAAMLEARGLQRGIGQSCAGNEEADICGGSSGSPLILREDEELFLFGIATWGVGCRTYEWGGVYQQVEVSGWPGELTSVDAGFGEDS